METKRWRVYPWLVAKDCGWGLLLWKKWEKLLAESLSLI
jgi:hypothetical protein